MKILIAYDGSPDAEAAIDDLARAGLPASGEAIVLTVAEVWLPPSGGIESSVPDEQVEDLLARHRAKGKALVGAATEQAAKAVERLKILLPDWKVTAETTYGSPAWEIVDAGEKQGVDLIVVGSQGLSALSRMLIGSISQKVLTEATRSVRVGRGKNNIDPSRIRLIVGFDSTKGARAAVSAVGSRTWPAETEVRLISVSEGAQHAFVGELVPPVLVDDGSDHAVLNDLARQAVDELGSAGLNVSHTILGGDPKNLLVEEAERWGADAIFVGANAYGSNLERFLIGSTSAAVAARASCSVEVVRIK